jgi:hypothetical protein
MDVAGWLRCLGLDRYEAVFRENGIDEQVLRHVTAKDLREIGVATVGDRRKLLAAIAELAPPSPPTEPRSSASLAVPLKTPEVSAERRPITVMFCDLVGSTSLAARLDAEDWRNLVNAYLDEASAAVTGLGGHVLKRLGDGLMALFGYPIAQENDAERAVRAAIAIQRGLAETKAKNAGKASLERLAEADLLFVEGLPPQANYRFKHALIQDAAYDSLLKSRRQALHRRAAELLRDQPERAAAEPEVVAHHFTQAGLDNPAIEWWGKAGDQALRRSAFEEAISHLGKAIAIADKGARPDKELLQPISLSADRKRLQTRFAEAVMWTKGYAAEEAKEAFERVRELSRAANVTEGPSETRARWLRGLVSGDFRAAQATARSYLQAAKRQGPEHHVWTGSLMVDMTSIFQGNFRKSRTYLERALNDSGARRGGGAFSHFALDVGASAAACLGLTSWYLGDNQMAGRLIDEALRDAEALGHAATLANALLFKIRLDACRGNPAATVRTSESLLALGREKGMDWFVAIGEAFANWGHGRLFDPALAATKLHEALTVYMDHGNKIDTPFFHGLLADLEATGPEAQAALKRIDRGLMIAAQTGEHCADAFLHRLQGEILLKRGPRDSAKAEEAFHAALAIARVQRARSYELLASLSLAKLYQSKSRPLEAHAVLAPALEGFSPTTEMPEIAEAQALLATVA